MKKREMDAWIMARKAEGCWVTICLSCGDLFAQLHKGRAGRRAILCDRKYCVLYRRWQNTYGRAPPGKMKEHWLKEHGFDARTGSDHKRHADPRFSEAA